MNTKQLKYVLAVEREGSFSKAADSLGITQPSLSQYIKKIEWEIGAELFDRINGEVRLTDSGRVYIEIGRKVLDLEHQMAMQLADVAGNKSGTVIIGAAPYRAAGMLPEITKRFHEEFPGICLQVREGTTSDLAEAMEHGEFDLALSLMPVDTGIFAYQKVTEEELLLAVPASFPQPAAIDKVGRKYPAVDAGWMNGQRFVTLTETQFMQRQLQRLLDEEQIQIRPSATVKSLEAQIAMVREGVGMALVPSGIERFCSPDEVIFYSLIQPLPYREVVVFWRRDYKVPGIVQRLIEIIQSIKW